MALPSSTLSSPSCRDYMSLMSYWHFLCKLALKNGLPKNHSHDLELSSLQQIALFQRVPFQRHSHFMGHGWIRMCPVSASFYVRSSVTGPFNDPAKLQMQLNYAVKKLNEFVPDPIYNFPWKRAESTAMQQLLVLGQRALKWSLIVLFIFSSSCDVLYSISRNKELFIPFGLFFGCITVDFLKETSQEVLHSKDTWMTWHLLGICCFFILVKIIAIYFSDRQSFLLHTANGGLMKVIWHWASSSQPSGDRGTNVVVEDASTTSSTAN